MKSIPHKPPSAFSFACALTVSLAGCGVNVTGVALDLPDSLEKLYYHRHTGIHL